MKPLRYLKPSILGQLATGRHAVIEASAGTGKTYTLEHLVIELIIERQAAIENILVVTFTEKATAELTTRVRQMIERLLDDFSPAPEGTPDEACWIVDDAARARLRQALFGFDGANISTIHAFCQRVLTENAFANRRLFEQTQVEGRAAFAAAFKDVLRRELAVDELQRSYLTAWLRWSGSVDDLEQLLYSCQVSRAQLRPRYERMAVEAAATAFAALGLTSAEVDRLALPGSSYSRERIATLVAILDDWRRDQDLPGLLGAIDAEESERGKKNGLFPYVRRKLAEETVKPGRPTEVAIAFRALDAALVSLPAAVAQRFLPSVAERLARGKREEGLFDFQDMLSLVDESLGGAGGERLIELLRARYHYALIDEFQDTDDVQWRIFERLFFEGPRPLFVIGDPKQAIYGFRGADVQTYVGAREQIRRSGGVVTSLDENFRTTPALIEAYNQVLRQDVADPFFSGSDIRYPDPVRCGNPLFSATDGAGRPVQPVVLFGLHPEHDDALRVSEIRRRLGARIAGEIRAILDGGLRFGPRGAEEPIGPKDVFLLTRTAAEGYELGRALRAGGIAHAYYKQEGLFQTDEARHIRDVLCAIDDPHSQSRRYKAWITPFFGLSLDELPACEELPGTHLLYERLFAWKALAEQKDYEQLFNRIVSDSGIVRRAVFLGDADETVNERALTNYLHIFELLLEQVSRTRSTLRELTLLIGSYIDHKAQPEGMSSNVQRLESEREAVQIMTLHKSKGLEAKVVFLYGGITQGFTGRVRLYHENQQRLACVGKARASEVHDRMERESREENERLLYVGLTRAKARLYLPWFADGAFSIQGCYKQLNQSLSRIVDERKGSAELEPLFALETLGAAPSRPGRHEASPAAQPPAPLAKWKPPRALTEDPPEADESVFAALRKRHAGFEITSYSRMKAAAEGGYRPATVELDGAPELEHEPQAALPRDPDELPGGAASGIFLHELIERLDFALVDGASLEAFCARPEVGELFEGARRRHDRETRHLPYSQRLIHTALTAPIRLGDGRVLPRGLGSARRNLREMEFLYPCPGGFIRGVVDFLFEHEGLVYFADWKSDVLPAYDLPAIGDTVEQRYRLQARLYALALVKMLGIRSAEEYERRFGGLLYCFLRGMRPGDEQQGIHFERPTFGEMLDWEAALGTTTT